MARTLPVCALLVFLPCLARADDAPTETVVRLSVTPQAPPTPALRYQLLPQLRDMNPGNPIQGYLMCFMEQNNFFFDKKAVEDREKWQTMPLKDLPLKDMQYYRDAAALRQADYAARLDAPDWQILLKMRRDGIGLLIPDVQWMRYLAAALKVRFRLEIAERRYDDALKTAQTMFGLSRHLGDHPTFIGNLVGVAVASLAVGPVEEMIQQPGSPNLYWALTDLRSPFLDLRKSEQGEMVWPDAEFHMLHLDDQAPMTDAQIKAVLDQIRDWMKLQEGPQDTIGVKGDPADWVAARAKDADLVQAARKRLIASGSSEEKVKQFPAQQVVLLDEKLAYEIQRDGGLATLGLPFWEAEKLAAASKEKRKEYLFPLWPADMKVRQTEARLDQRLALLRCVEALRAYAAENDGKLPAKLDDVKLPLPVDPVTGKPFPYELKGGTATLRGTPAAGREKEASFNVRYEVTIAK